MILPRNWLKGRSFPSARWRANSGLFRGRSAAPTASEAATSKNTDSLRIPITGRLLYTAISWQSDAALQAFVYKPPLADHRQPFLAAQRRRAAISRANAAIPARTGRRGAGLQPA